MFRKRIIMIALIICLMAIQAFSQLNSMESLLRDASKQDELIAAIGHNHQLIMKIVDELSTRPHFVQMMKERFMDDSGSSKPSPYAGEESRKLKALSDEQISQYLNGEGMGLAKAAELNEYPGPKHVLDLSRQLQLSPEVMVKVQQSYDGMHNQAVHLGKQIVEKERVLDSLFSTKSIDNITLTQLVKELSELQGQLRVCHLNAHLETAQLLSKEQIKQYRLLRGYDSEGTMHHDHH